MKQCALFYAKLNILKLDDLIDFEKACFLFKYKPNKLPYVFNNCFKYTSNNHEKYTRVGSCINYFFPFIEITNCKNRLNIKFLRHGMFVNLL